jgi:hypothetical protein
LVYDEKVSGGEVMNIEVKLTVVMAVVEAGRRGGQLPYCGESI